MHKTNLNADKISKSTLDKPLIKFFLLRINFIGEEATNLNTKMLQRDTLDLHHGKLVSQTLFGKIGQIKIVLGSIPHGILIGMMSIAIETLTIQLNTDHYARSGKDAFLVLHLYVKVKVSVIQDKSV